MMLLWQKRAMVNVVNHTLPWSALHWAYQAAAEAVTTSSSGKPTAVSAC